MCEKLSVRRYSSFYAHFVVSGANLLFRILLAVDSYKYSVAVAINTLFINARRAVPREHLKSRLVAPFLNTQAPMGESLIVDRRLEVQLGGELAVKLAYTELAHGRWCC